MAASWASAIAAVPATRATSAATAARKMSATIRMARSRTCRRGAVSSSSGSAVRSPGGLVRGIPKRAVPSGRSLGIPTAGIPGRGQADAHGADGEHAHTHEEQELFVGHVRSFLARRGLGGTTREGDLRWEPDGTRAGGPAVTPDALRSPDSVATVQRTKRTR